MLGKSSCRADTQILDEWMNIINSSRSRIDKRKLSKSMTYVCRTVSFIYWWETSHLTVQWLRTAHQLATILWVRNLDGAQLGFPGDSDGKESACNARGRSSISGLGRPFGEGTGNPLPYLAWRRPWTEEPVRLQSMGLQRVGNDWVTWIQIHSLQLVCLSLFHMVMTETTQMILGNSGWPHSHDWVLAVERAASFSSRGLSPTPACHLARPFSPCGLPLQRLDFFTWWLGPHSASGSSEASQGLSSQNVSSSTLCGESQLSFSGWGWGLCLMVGGAAPWQKQMGRWLLLHFRFCCFFFFSSFLFFFFQL